MPRLWVGIDQGSTATKACLVDGRGLVRRTVSVPVGIRFPRPLRAEHAAENLARSVSLALSRLLRGVNLSRVSAVGLAAQRSSFLFWDRQSGRPLTPVLSWQDRRAESICRTLDRHRETIRRRTGLRLSPHYAAGKIRWLLDRSPSLQRRAERGEARFGTLDAFLLHRLTGGVSWSTDPTQAARTLLMDLRTLDWDPDLLDLFGVPLPALPPIRPSVSPAARIRIRGASLPVTATLGDQQAALIGLGCLREREMAVNYGTGAFVVLNTGSRLRRALGLLTSVAWTERARARYLLEGTVNAAGNVVDWIRRLTGLRTRLLRSVSDLDRLPLVVPAFSGLGAPHWVARARGAILDLDTSLDGDDLAAAALAGVASRVREIVEVMAESGLKPRRIVAGGGLAKWPALLPLQAGFLGRAIVRASAAEGTARGAALLAAHAAGEIDLMAGSRLRPRGTTVRPAIPAGRTGRYYRRFRRAVAEVARLGSQSGSGRTGLSRL